MIPNRIHTARRGFTLIEAVLSMAITAGLLVAALSTLGAMARIERSAAQREVTLALAQDLAGEIMQAAYEDPDDDAPVFGPDPGDGAPGHVRRKFDDVDDYDGWVSSPPVTRDGDPITGGIGYERRVTVRYAAVDDPTPGNEPDVLVDSGLKQVTVEVDSDGGHASIVILRSRHGNADREPSVETTFVRWVGVTLRLGEDGHPLSSGTSVMNQIGVEVAP